MASTKILSVAIDFGTSYSGYAFSFKHDPKQILTFEWDNGNGATSARTPTSVLFDENRKLDSFGYDAEKKYADVSQTGQAGNWFFFKRFKMSLLKGQGLDKDTMIKDYTGKEMAALTVISGCIKFLRGHLMRKFRSILSLISAESIQWVMTVPALWSDAAKQFMRTAAEKAGIKGEQLFLIFEPEAAALWCRSSRDIKRYQTGSKFMVIDCGGGTVDITVHQVEADGKLREVHRPSGGPWGGTKVDDAFQEFILNLCGLRAIRLLSKHDVLQLDQSFETVKRSVKFALSGRHTYQIRLPKALLQTADVQINPGLKVVGDKLKIPLETVHKFFDCPIKKIVHHIRDLFQDSAVRDTETVYLVGGMSECPLLKSSIKNILPSHVHMYKPEEAASSVLKGAVVYGHSPDVIGWRIASFTYGVTTCSRFQNYRHDASKKIMIEGEEFCNDLFDIFIRKDDVVENGHKTSCHTYFPTNTGQTMMYLSVCISSDQNPFYTTELGCRQLGTLVVQMPDRRGEKHRTVTVEMEFEGIEFKVNAVDRNTGVRFTSTFHFD